MVIREVLGKRSVALPCFPDKLAVQRGSRCGTVDAAGPGSPGVSWEHGAGGLGDSLGHPPPGQAGASVVGPSLPAVCPCPPRMPPARGCTGGPWVVSTVVPSPLRLLSSHPWEAL